MPTATHDPKRRALGKGLESLLPARPATPPPAPATPVESNGKPLEIPLDHIERNPWQTRTHFDEAKLTGTSPIHRRLRSRATHCSQAT